MICTFPKDVHDPITVRDTSEVVEAYCKKCKAHEFFRKDPENRPEPRYAKFFRKDTLQPSQNLYYRVFPGRMSVEETKSNFLA